ncbi:MAG TPA: hypothetical protein VL983_06485 [Terriglobales bacterium]|nr:hypothetical protein [Terriglobales bacterium]
MKKLMFLLAVMAIALTFSGNALAQGDNSVYFVTYYSNNASGAPDGTVRFINDGDTGANLYAAIYVFDDSQELQACGACVITPDGVLSEDVKTELTNNPLTGRVPTRGVIKVLSSSSWDPTNPWPVAGLRGFATHIQRATPTSGAYATTETAVADANLTSTEEWALANLCYYAGLLGSGQGTITCTPEDHDF